jgi:hypothetical protein
VVKAMIERARKRKSLGSDMPRQPYGTSRPAELSRAYAAVIQNDGVSIIELLRRFRSSDEPSTMAALTGLVDQVEFWTDCVTSQNLLASLSTSVSA